MKDWQRSAAVVAITAVVLGGCSKAANVEGGAGRHPWTRSGVFRWSTNANPQNLNPMLSSASPTLDLSMFIYSYAVRYNDKAEPVPDALSEIPSVANGDVSKDGLTLKYKLRHNITFQDGVPLTCKDLKFTWKAVMNPHNNVITTDGYKDIKDIDCSDPYVAVVHMRRLYAPYLQQLWSVNGNAPIEPEHILAKFNDDKGSFNTAPFNSMPIGSGPFRVVAWQRGQEIRMEAYPKYFLGKPKLNEVVFKIMSDENTLETQLQTHEIDMLALGTAINWPRYEALGSDPRNGLKAIRVDSYQFSHIDFNLNRPIVGDVNVRRALAFGTDRAAIIDKVEHGSATAAETDQHPTLSWGWNNDIVHYPYDPAKARALLDSDGWKVGPDGVRVKNGQRLEFTYSTQTESTNGRAIQTFVQRQWRDIGVQADVKNYPTNQFFDNSTNGILQGLKYDVAAFSWIGAADPDDSAIYSGDNLAPHGQNAMMWNNRLATAAMNDALKTLDQPRRKRDYAVVQQQLAKDVPTLILFFVRVPYVYNTDLKNFTPSSVISAFWNPWEYEI